MIDKLKFLRKLSVNLPFYLIVEHKTVWGGDRLRRKVVKEKKVKFKKGAFDPELSDSIEPLVYSIEYRPKQYLNHYLELNLHSKLDVTEYPKTPGFYYSQQRNGNVIIRRTINPDNLMEKEIRKMLRECERFAFLYCKPY